MVVGRKSSVVVENEWLCLKMGGSGRNEWLLAENGWLWSKTGGDV